MNYKALLCKLTFHLRFRFDKISIAQNTKLRNDQKKIVHYIFMRSNDLVPTHLSESEIWMILIHVLSLLDSDSDSFQFQRDSDVSFKPNSK